MRETGLKDFYYYHSDIKSSLDVKWNSSAAKMKAMQDIIKTSKERVKDSCNFNGELKNYPVSVNYKSNSYGDKSNCENLNIEIISLSPGVIWTPLIKSTDFKATASCSHAVSLFKESNGNIDVVAHTLHANITVSGHISVYGISSYRHTKQLIIEHIQKQIYEQTKSHLGNIKY